MSWANYFDVDQQTLTRADLVQVRSFPFQHRLMILTQKSISGPHSFSVPPSKNFSLSEEIIGHNPLLIARVEESWIQTASRT